MVDAATDLQALQLSSDLDMYALSDDNFLAQGYNYGSMEQWNDLSTLDPTTNMAAPAIGDNKPNQWTLSSVADSSSVNANTTNVHAVPPPNIATDSKTRGQNQSSYLRQLEDQVRVVFNWMHNHHRAETQSLEKIWTRLGEIDLRLSEMNHQDLDTDVLRPDSDEIRNVHKQLTQLSQRWRTDEQQRQEQERQLQQAEQMLKKHQHLIETMQSRLETLNQELVSRSDVKRLDALEEQCRSLQGRMKVRQGSSSLSTAQSRSRSRHEAHTRNEKSRSRSVRPYEDAMLRGSGRVP